MRILRHVILITVLTLTFSWGVFAHAQSQCRSEKGGYCVSVDSPKIEEVKGPGVLARLAAPIPGLEFLVLPDGATIGDIMAAIYYFSFTLIGLSALFWFVLGGIKYMLAGDKDPTKAKQMMKNAITGLALALTSWLILFTINPDLVKSLDLSFPVITPLATPTPVGESISYICDKDRIRYPSLQACTDACARVGDTGQGTGECLTELPPPPEVIRDGGYVCHDDPDTRIYPIEEQSICDTACRQLVSRQECAFIAP